MQRKSILFVIDNMKIGGIQKNMLNSLIALNDKFDLTLCVFNAVGEYLELIAEDLIVRNGELIFFRVFLAMK